jgi:capsule polysaccharide export protein KpsE/RkpR
VVRALQASNIPTVAFDTATAIGQVEVSAHEKQSAVDLYADLVKRSANLMSLNVGPRP